MAAASAALLFYTSSWLLYYLLLLSFVCIAFDEITFQFNANARASWSVVVVAFGLWLSCQRRGEEEKGRSNRRDERMSRVSQAA